MAYVFLSFVGTQYPGVFQSLAACIEDGLDVAEVQLYVSGRSEVVDNAQRLRAWCEDSRCIPVTLFDWDSRNNDVQSIVAAARATGHDIIFNLDGGMNYAVAALMPELDACGASVVGCNSSCAWMMPLADGTMRELAQPAPMPIREFLQQQGIKWEHASPLEDLSAELRKAGQPGNSLEHVRIGSMIFDVVWNTPGNRLSLFANLARFVEGGTEAHLAELRNAAMWAATRNESSHLYDRDVYVLCIGPQDEQHIQEESRGKVKAMCNSSRPRGREEAFRQMFRGGVTAPKAKGSRKVEDDTLVVVLSDDAASTMAAIASHDKPNIVLCHTPDDVACRKADRLRRLMEAEGKTVRTLQTDISGTLLPGQLRLAGDPASVAVNVTPGTKPQGAFLALWAARNGCGIWSVDSRGGCLRNLQTGGTLPTRDVDALHLFGVRYDEVLHEAVPETDDFYDMLLDSMRKGLAGDSWILWQACKGRGLDCVRIPSPQDSKAHSLVISRQGKVVREYEPDGAWLEGLAAYVLQKAGATHLHTSVRLFWQDEDLQEYLEKKCQKKVFRMEMDVLGTWDTASLLVSCKAMKLDAAQEVAVAEEAQSMAANLSRFTIPLVCCTGCDQWHHIDVGKSKVVIFGWRELCQPEVLRQIVEETRKELSTTGKEAKA